jgi:glycosyltransferase involved in cell wall biosynthesis
MGQYLAALRACPAPRILTQYEPGFETAREAWQAARGRSRPVLGLDALAWRGFERRVLSRVQAVVAFTEPDRAVLTKLAGATPVVTIRRGTILAEHPSHPAGTRAGSLLFVGNFVHPPNADAALRLARNILPLVRARYPHAVLTLVGDQPPAELRALADDSVRVTGRVPNLAPELEQAAVVVVPLSHGGGVRIKVLDALAAGKAIVASPLAVAGLGVRDGLELIVAQTDQDFAASIVRLLDSEEDRVALATRARVWALANLRWEASLRAYEELYDRLLGPSSE